MPGPDELEDLEGAPSAPTAKTLSVRDVLVEPQVGHFTLAVEFIVRCNCSNVASQALHAYS
jgi:hypothetical protein